MLTSKRKEKPTGSHTRAHAAAHLHIPLHLNATRLGLLAGTGSSLESFHCEPPRPLNKPINQFQLITERGSSILIKKPTNALHTPPNHQLSRPFNILFGSSRALLPFFNRVVPDEVIEVASCQQSTTTLPTEEIPSSTAVANSPVQTTAIFTTTGQGVHVETNTRSIPVRKSGWLIRDATVKANAPLRFASR